MDFNLQPAKQERSRETQKRILQAASRLLEDRLFESISIREIIAEAKTSIGSFYARFKDKHALLPVLYAEYEERLQERVTKLRSNLARADDLSVSARMIVKHFVEAFGETPNLNRALFEYVAESSQLNVQDTAKRRHGQYEFIIEALLAHVDDKSRSSRRRVELAVYFMVANCRNRLLYPELPSTQHLQISQAELQRELTKQLIAYVQF